jgi:hypothetical protein
MKARDVDRTIYGRENTDEIIRTGSDENCTISDAIT